MTNTRRASEDKLAHAKREIKALNAKLEQKDDLIKRLTEMSARAQYNRRMGKKDELIKEIEKIKDYCQRWIDVEKSR